MHLCGGASGLLRVVSMYRFSIGIGLSGQLDLESWD